MKKLKKYLKIVFYSIFKPRKIDRMINEAEWKAYAVAEKEAEAKLNMILDNEMEKGIVHPNFKSPVLEVPFYGAERIDAFCSSNVTYPRIADTTRKVSKMHTSFCSERTRIEYIKSQAADAIAKQLIDNGYLNARTRYSENSHAPVVEFSINVFGS